MELQSGGPINHYFVLHTSGRELHLVGAVPDQSSNGTQCLGAPIATKRLVSDRVLSVSALKNFPYTFALSGANNAKGIVMSERQQKYRLLHRSCDGAAMLLPEVKYTVVRNTL